MSERPFAFTKRFSAVMGMSLVLLMTLTTKPALSQSAKKTKVLFAGDSPPVASKWVSRTAASLGGPVTLLPTPKTDLVPTTIRPVSATFANDTHNTSPIRQAMYWQPTPAEAASEYTVPEVVPPPPLSDSFKTTTPLAGHEDPNILPVSCPNCGPRGYGAASGCSRYNGGLFGHRIPKDHCCPGIDCNPVPDDCCTRDCGRCCVPGQEKCCSRCEGRDPCTRLLCDLYYCTCCPDPCYVPRWIGVANAGFFVNDARPVTTTRLRYNGAFNIDRPDRAEYFIKQFAGTTIGRSADYNEFRLFNEVATGGFGFFTELPFRSIEFDPAVSPATQPSGDAGMGDLTIGTKSIMLDCELLLVTFQMTTYLKTGIGANGLGTGHVSLEPAFLTTLKLTPDFYMQAETAWWIPIAGGAVASNVWHNHISFNYILHRFLPDVQLIGTFEIANWNVLDAYYTDPDTLPGGQATIRESPTYFVNAGPGIRLNVCDHIDFGAGTIISLTNDDFVAQAVRFDFRWRY